MNKNVSIAETSEKKAGPEGGLTSIAGGWEGSDELVKILENSPRSGQHDIPDPEP
jgi:hypothetical protein